MRARTLTARYVGAVARPYKISCADGAAAAVVSLVGFLLLVELVDLLLNIGIELLFLLGKLAEQRGVGAYIALQRRDDRSGLGDVLFLLSLESLELCLAVFHLGLGLLILGLDGLEICDRLTVSILELLIASHDIADIVYEAEEFADTACAEQNLKIIVSARLLHRTDADLILFKLSIRHLLSLVDLLGLLLDKLGVQLYLLVKIEYLLYGDGVLLVQRVFQRYLVVLLTLKRIDCRLQAVLLTCKLRLLRLQSVYLGLRHGESRNGQAREHDAHRHDQSHRESKKLFHFFLQHNYLQYCGLVTIILYTPCQAEACFILRTAPIMPQNGRFFVNKV